jgi:predicted MFS family arabinose efflux permease
LGPGPERLTFAQIAKLTANQGRLSFAAAWSIGWATKPGSNRFPAELPQSKEPCHVGNPVGRRRRAPGIRFVFPAKPALGTGLILAMAATTGLGVANIYYNQPMLGLIEASMPGGLTALVPTVTQLGYALGLFLLVPLGDRVERRRLIVAQFLLLSVALVLAAVAPSPALLLGASLILGALATVAQQIVPFAAHLAPPERSGAVIGKVMAGLLCGILLSRTLAGFVAQQAGWRAMFWLGVPLALVAAAILRAMLPTSAAAQGPRYPQLLASLWHLWRRHRALRLATITQGLLFAAFSAFWSILALRLAQVGEGRAWPACSA